MLINRPSRLATLAAIAALATGCGTTTEPESGSDFDTAEALADYDALTTALGSAELLGFRALGSRTPFGGAPAAVDVMAGTTSVTGPESSRTFALRLFQRLAAEQLASGPTAAPIISDRHRGATFVYDPDLDHYVVDPERTGAPETGVRLILYELDAAGIPIVERETGHADLVDEGDGSAEDIVLHLTVEHEGTTVLDYRTTLDGGEGRGALTVRGFLRGDGVRLDFDIEAVGTDADGTKTLDVAFDLRVAARDFRITGSVHGIQEESGGEGDVDVTVRHRASSIRVDVRGEHGEIDGTVFLNGDIFATVSGPGDEPIFRSRDGEPLGPGQMLVLGRIFDTIEDVFDLLEDLLDPVDDLVVLGIIL